MGSIAGAVAAGLMSVAAAASAEDLVRFTQTSTSMLYMPVYVAEQMGYFQEERITPEIHHFKAGGSAALAAVIGGNMDIYIGAASSAVRAAGQQTDAVIIAPLVTRYTIDLVLRQGVAESVGITPASTEQERFKALKGLKIGVSGVGSGTHQIAQYAVSRAGLDPERDATMVFVGGGAPSVAAMAAGRIDAATLSSPASEIAVRDHGASILVDGAGGGYSELDGFLYVALISTNRWIDSNPDVARRTVRGFSKALHAMHDPELSPKARDAVHAKYFDKIEKSVFDAAWQRMLPGFTKSPKLDRAQMQRVVDFLNEFSDKPVDVDVGKVFTDRFVDVAAQ